MITMKKLSGLAVVASIFIGSMQAQSKNEAIAAYNAGVGLMTTDVPGAINSFEKSIQISEQVGDSAVEIKDKAIAVLPDLYYKQALKLYNDKNPGAKSAAKSTISVAEKYKNDKTGAPAYSPKILLKILLLAYTRGITSSKKIEQGG